jgi:hypothetical protein
MTQHVLVAVYIEDDKFEAALPSRFGPLIVESFPNTSEGMRQFADWAVPHLGTQNPKWCATVPKGDGGAMYSWLHDSSDDLFLQNPARLQEYAERNGLRWQSAETLHRFNMSKAA